MAEIQVSKRHACNDTRIGSAGAAPRPAPMRRQPPAPYSESLASPVQNR